MSKKDKRPSFSFSNENFMLGCFEDKYFLNFLLDRGRKTSQIFDQHTVYIRQASNYEGSL